MFKKRFIAIMGLFVLAIILVGCGEAKELAKGINEASNIFIDNDNATSVTQDLNLITESEKIPGLTISWHSENQAVITNEGIVSRTTDDVVVKLILTVSFKNHFKTSSVIVTVKAIKEAPQPIKYEVTLIGPGLKSAVNDNNEVTVMITIPNEKTLDQLLVDGVDVTANVVNDKYIQTLTKDVTIEVIYKDIEVTKTYEVTFNTNGGTSIDSIEVSEGMSIYSIEKPTKTDFFLIGWYTDEELRNKFIIGETLINSDTILYAAWSNEQIDGLEMIGSTIHWNEIDGATYEIEILGQLETTNIPSFDVDQFKNQLKAKGIKITTLLNNEIENYKVLYVTYENDKYLSAEEGDSSNLRGYYLTAKGLRGDDLVAELQSIITNTMSAINYGDIRYMLEESDLHPTRPNELSLIYNNVDFNGRIPYAKPIWDQGKTWNREHTWPQSRLGQKASNGTKNRASDGHNLRAIDNPVNSHRGNRYFNLRQPGVTNHLGHHSSSGYYPGDIDKGDVARIMMYMGLRYEGSIHLTNNISLMLGNGTYSGKLEYFYDWHFEDQVDDFEIRRNEIIFDWQKNRNPFIDHPELLKPVYDYLTRIDNER